MRRSTTGMLATSALLGVALLAPTPALAVEGEFAAEATGSQLFVDAVNFGAFTAEPPVGSVSTIGVSPTQGQVDTAGLGDGVISRGFGQNLDLTLLDQTVPLDLSTAEQTAPPDNTEPEVSTLADLSQAAPLLTGSVSQSTALARDPALVECPDVDQRAVISEGTSTTTDLGVLEIEEGNSLISVQDPGDGTLTSSSGTYVGSEGQVDTAGLGDGIESRGFGQNLDLTLLDQTVPLDLSTAEQTAPPDNDEPVVSTLADLSQAAPLLTGSVSQSTAFARDPEAVECPDQDERAVVSEGTSTTTDLGVLEVEEGTSLISVQDPGDGTLTSSSGTYIGSEGQVIAESSAQTAAANVANELVVEVLNPTLTATATGTSGGASVEYTGEVRVNGEKIAGAQENKLSLEALRDVLLPLDEEALNTLLGPLDENVVNPLLEPLAEALPLLDGEQLTGETLVGLIDDGAIQLDELAFLEPTVLVTAGQLENVTESSDGTQAAGEARPHRGQPRP